VIDVLFAETPRVAHETSALADQPPPPEIDHGVMVPAARPLPIRLLVIWVLATGVLAAGVGVVVLAVEPSNGLLARRFAAVAGSAAGVVVVGVSGA
jgi:hypothetical protein